MKNGAFTLIELLIVIGIIIIVTAVSTVYYRGFQTEKLFDQEVGVLFSQLKRIRSDAVNGKIENANCSNSISGYMFDSLCTDKYDLQVCCAGINGCQTFVQQNWKTIKVTFS